MKKYIPLIILGLGIVVVVVVLLVLKPFSKNTQAEVSDQESALIEVALEDRPVASLTPTSDGHWLNLVIDKVKIDAKTMDYELIYQLPDGRTQGVPGTVTLQPGEAIEKKILLGSESSGKFRYDEGVKDGTLTLRFRNDQGKLLAKFTSDFVLLSGTKELESVDGKFIVNLNKLSTKTFYVVMPTFGVPQMPSEGISEGPYGFFSSDIASISGGAQIGSSKVLHFNGDAWDDSFSTGIFVGVSQ